MGILWRGDNLSFTQPEREGRVEDLSAVRDLRARKREMGFPLWGGDKTWLAPQTRWTDGVPFLDLDSGPYALEVEQAGPERAVARMTSRVCRETGVQVRRTVTLAAGTHEWIVTHRLLNSSSMTVHWGVWDVNMVLRPGKVFLPRRTDSPYPNGVKTFAGEGESAQVREAVVGELGNLAVIDCRESKAFKFGVDAQEGWMLAVLHVPGLGLTGYRKQVPVYRDKPYGHGCIAEVYNSDRYPYFEMEIHGPVTALKPNETFELEERQALFDLSRWPQSEDEVRQHLDPLL
ncbi:MAG: hypothetical protein ACE5IQ_14760 [Candidatus Methylomirabilales bacterium]